MRARINANVQLAPPAARPDTTFLIQPFALAVNLEADGAQQAFGLTQRLMKYQAQCETGLDGNLRIDRLATAFSGRWGMPGRNRFFGKPNRDAASPLSMRNRIPASS